MSKTPKPIIHGRDHEHGGADPTRIVYETVGDDGGGGTGTVGQGRYTASLTLASGVLLAAAWSHSAGDELLDLTVNDEPTFLADGIYAVHVSVILGPPPG